MDDFIALLILAIMFLIFIWRVVSFFIEVFKNISVKHRDDSPQKIINKLKKERPELYKKMFEPPPDLLVHPDEECKKQIIKVKSAINNEEKFEKLFLEQFILVGTSSGLKFNETFELAFEILLDAVIFTLDVRGQLRDTHNHISHNKYALLDFALYHYFLTRATLLCRKFSLERVRETDDTFFAIVESYFNEIYLIPKEKINRIIDNRMCEYEKIVTSMSDENLDKEMISQLCQFIQKDYHSIPLDSMWFMGSADEEFFIKSEIKILENCIFPNTKQLFTTFLSHPSETKNLSI